jgi:hypothetical protein
MRFHKSGSSRAEVTLARWRVLSACRTSVERFVVEVAHRQHGCLSSVHLQDPLVEVAERLSGDGTVSLRFELTAAAAGPVITEDSPSPRSRSSGCEIDLHDLACGMAAHHDMEEH